jgi:CubicO group peptidase (beta-lactamase class C family)
VLAFGVLGLLAAFLSRAPATQAPARPIVAGKFGTEADQFLERCVPFGFAGSVLIVANGETLLRKGYGAADPERSIANSTRTLFDIGSLTKQFTATAILVLEAKGKLATKDPIARFIEGVPSDKQAITIHHLLTHTSGIAGTLSTIGSATTDRSEFVHKVLEAPLAAEPGTHFEYSNTGYGVLAVIVEIAGGQSFETFLEENLFKPAGMTHTGFCQESRISREPMAVGFENGDRIGTAVEGWYSWGLRGAGGVLTSVEDVEHWEDALAGRSILSKELRSKLYTPELETYAYGWRVGKDDHGRRLAEHGGTTRGFEAKYLRHLDEDTSIAILSNNRDLGPSIPVALDHLVHGEPYSHPPKIVRLEAKALAARAGKFALSPDSGLDVRVSADGLAVSAYGQSAVDALLLQKPDAEKCARMTSAATKFVAALDAAQGERVDDLLKPKHLPDGRVLVENWNWRREKNGALKSSRVLGCMSSSEGGGACYLRLVFEKKEETLRLGWTGDRIDGVHYDEKLPFSRTFLPESPKSFVHFETISLWARQRIAFELLPDGSASGLSLKEGRDDVRFTRTGK